MAANEAIDKSFINDIDKWIEQLYECKQLTEIQVKLLCDKVSIYYWHIAER